MPIAPPPPVLASARVLEYAAADDSVTYTGRNVIVVAGRQLGPVPCLAIGRELSGGRILLLYCDEAWDKLAASEHQSVEDAKRAAEEAYSGITAKWQTVSFRDEEVAAFLDEEDRGLICSFCGRHPHEVERIVTGHRGAAICEICIRDLRRQVRGD